MVRFTLDTMPPALPDFSKMDYELNLFEIIQRSPIPKEDEENNVRISSKWIPKSYNYIILNLESCKETNRIYEREDGTYRYSKSKRSYIVRCCIHLGHAIFQRNEFIKEFMKEFYDNAKNSISIDEHQLFYPSNPEYFLENDLLKLHENKNIYISKKVLDWADTNKQIFNMTRHELVLLLFCLGAHNLPNLNYVYNPEFIEDIENIIKKGSDHILKRRLQVEMYYKEQELKKKNIFTPLPTDGG